jgi:hypothetical protein
MIHADTAVIIDTDTKAGSVGKGGVCNRYIAVMGGVQQIIGTIERIPDSTVNQPQDSVPD